MHQRVNSLYAHTWNVLTSNIYISKDLLSKLLIRNKIKKFRFVSAQTLTTTLIKIIKYVEKISVQKTSDFDTQTTNHDFPRFPRFWVKISRSELQTDFDVMDTITITITILVRRIKIVHDCMIWQLKSNLMTYTSADRDTANHDQALISSPSCG